MKLKVGKIRGLSAVKKELRKLSAEARKAGKRAVNASARAVRDSARSRVPVKTGELKKSITTRVSRKGIGARVGTNDEAGPFVEFGTVRQAAKPFLFPAAEQERANFVRRMADETNAVLKSGGK